MYTNYRRIPMSKQNNERFGGFVGPLLLGGVAGYALGNNNVFGGNGNSGIIYPIYPPRPYYYPMVPYSSNQTSNYYYY